MPSQRHSRREVMLAALAAAAPALGCGRAPELQPSALAFLTVGDWGRRGGRIQTAVAQQMSRRAEAIGSQFVMTVGDNFYDDGVRATTDSHWKESFEDVYAAASLQTPWHPALGNHDYDGDGDPDAQVAYSAASPRWRMPARYYMLRRKAADRTVDLFVLDTTLHVRPRDQDAALRTAQAAWFGPALAASDADWKLVFGHHPVYSNGWHGGSHEVERWLKPLLQANGVQAYVCGHDHDLQHIVSGGVHYVLTGGGSESRAVKSRDRWVPGTQAARGMAGFTSYRLTGDVLQVDWIDAQGVTRHAAAIPRTAVAVPKAA